MDVQIKPSVYVPAFLLLGAVVAVAVVVELPEEWILLPGLVGLGLLFLVLPSLFPRMRLLPSLRPDTWVFVVSYLLLALLAVALSVNSRHVGLIGVGAVAVGLGTLWRGIRRNRRWAWNCTRRIYSVAIGCLLLDRLLMLLRRGAFQQEYVSEFGWVLGILVYCEYLLFAICILFIAREALRTPVHVE